MFSYIKGEIAEVRDNQIVLENNGMGYEIFVSGYALKSFSEVINTEVKVYTYFQVKEDGVALFGFYSEEEKNMFLNLISVAGLGPKGAINILSSANANDLSVIIASGDVLSLSKIKGIGKKTAERLITELKDKVEVVGNVNVAQSFEGVTNSEIEDAVVVLMSLGLSKMEATTRAREVYKQNDTAEDIIRKSLVNS